MKLNKKEIKKKVKEKSKHETLTKKEERELEYIFDCVNSRICFKCGYDLDDLDCNIWWNVEEATSAWSYYIICDNCGLEELKEVLASKKRTIEDIKIYIRNAKKKK